MLISQSPNGCKFEYVAVQEKGKIHLQHINSLLMCNTKHNAKVNEYVLDMLKNKRAFKNILKNKDFCSKCKEEIELDMYNYTLYFS